MRVYNTLTRKKEELKTITPNEVKIYACGPTVYNFIHIGNARPLCVFDTFRRYLEYRGYKVNFVQNFTDIDDKIIKRANEEGTDYKTVSEKYIAEFWTDVKGMNIREATVHPKATENIDEIIKESDGIMVARGDLGVEIPPEEVPHIQKVIIQKCNDSFKPVITATQMLDSMIRNPRPTRAEVADVANAIYDGTDATMLSGETAMGKYPVEALRMMAQIAENAEKHLDYKKMLKEKQRYSNASISNAVSYSSVSAADQLKAKAIITPSLSGFTTRQVSKYKPQAIIIGASPEEKVLRKMQLYWGVKPIKTDKEETTEAIMETAMQLAKEKRIINSGDIVVITAGVAINPGQGGGVTNLMKIETIK